MKDFKFLFEKFVLKQHPVRIGAEPKVVKLISSESGNYFIDIGCNRGEYSRLAKKRFKNVISIDPNPKWKAPYQFAISDKSEQAEFYFGDGWGGADSLLKDPHILGIDWKSKDPIQVTTIRFDDLGIDADLVKIDVEGAEFKVLAGMEKHLPRKIVVELHDERRENELISVLEQKGYNVRKIDDTHFFSERF